MERGREARRASGPASAPRRPRTTGFKDSPGREDEEVTDEPHNSRLRDRSSRKDGLTLRKKRKRQEIQAPADEADDSTEETEGGASEDDDDAPPPIPRWSGKSRPGGKFVDDGGLDLPTVVPRKARSAIVKRNHDASSHAATPPQHSPSTQAPSSTPSSSSAAANKPGRRLKPNGSKARPAKIAKSSPAPISEQEVEVAEALFDLARMVPSLHKPDKPAAVPTSSSVLAQSATPLSPSASPLASHSAPHSAEAPRRKRPRIRPREEAPVRPSVTAAHDRNCAADRGIGKMDNVSKQSTLSSLPVSGIQTSTGQQQLPEHDGQINKPESASEIRSDVANDGPKRKSLESRPPKFEIDLMAPPSGLTPNDAVDCSAEDRSAAAHPQGPQLPWLEKERERLRDKEVKEKEQQKDSRTEDTEAKREPDGAERECLDLNKQGLAAQRIAAKGPKVDGKATQQKADRSVSAAVVSAASSFLNASTSSCSTAPSPMNMTSWPGGLPSVGYYGPAAAVVAAAAAAGSWPQAAAGATEENNASHPPQVIPYLSGRHSWKRCAIHVFIARFIDVQQQMARHSLMAATYTASAYGGKPYNLNIPASDGIFGSGTAGVNSVTGTGSNSNVTGVPTGSDRGPFPNGQGAKGSPFADALYRKHPQQQQLQQHGIQGGGPAFGFPVAPGGSNSANAAAPSSSSGTSASTAPSSSSVITGSSNNSGAASMAAHAQIFQAVMQHNPFSFQFPASFGSHAYNGAQNIGQQAAQFVNNPFYASHLVQHPSQAQQQGQAATSQKAQAGRMISAMNQQQFASGYSASQQGLAGGLQGEKEASREAGDNKLPALQRLMFGQQPGNNGAPNLNVLPSPSAMGQDGLQDFSAQAGKQHMNKSPGLQHASGQHAGLSSQLHQATGQHGGTSSLQMSFKNIDSQSSQVSTSMATTRSSLGPGPLGLAPVAPVMAPQGHVVLQGMAADQASQARLQTHLHSMQSGQQPRSSQPRMLGDDATEGNRSQDDRKLAAKRGPLETLPSMQGSPTSGNSSSRMSSSGAAMNLLATGPAVSSRFNVHSTQAAAATLQAAGQNLKQGAGRTKAALSAGAAPQIERARPFTGAASNKPGPGQSQVQPPSHHPAQLKLPQRPNAGPVPGPSVMGNALAKNQRIPAANQGPPPTTMTKQGNAAQKSAGKGSLSLSQKPATAVPGKRSPAATSSSSGQNQTVKNVPQQQQASQQVSSPQNQASSPQHQYQAHQVTPPQQPNHHQQKQTFPQQLQMRHSQQQALPQQQGNALSLSSQGLSLGSNGNGRDNSFSVAKNGSSSNRGSPANSCQRGNGLSVPLLHQTSSPGGTAVNAYPTGGKSSPEQKNESETPNSSPMKTFGRQQQAQQSTGTGTGTGTGKCSGYGEAGVQARASPLLAAQASTCGLPASSSAVEVRSNVTSTPAVVVQQQPQQAATPTPLPSSSSHLVAATPTIAVAASSGSPGLLGQSSASALRP